MGSSGKLVVWLDVCVLLGGMGVHGRGGFGAGKECADYLFTKDEDEDEGEVGCSGIGEVYSMRGRGEDGEENLSCN